MNEFGGIVCFNFAPNEFGVEVGVHCVGFDADVVYKAFGLTKEGGCEIFEGIDALCPCFAIHKEEAVSDATNRGAGTEPDIHVPDLAVSVRGGSWSGGAACLAHGRMCAGVVTCSILDRGNLDCICSKSGQMLNEGPRFGEPSCHPEAIVSHRNDVGECRGNAVHGRCRRKKGSCS